MADTAADKLTCSFRLYVLFAHAEIIRKMKLLLKITKKIKNQPLNWRRLCYNTN